MSDRKSDAQKSSAFRAGKAIIEGGGLSRNSRSARLDSSEKGEL